MTASELKYTLFAFFKITEGQYHAQFSRQFLKTIEQRHLSVFGGQGKVPFIPILTEIGCLKQLLQQDNIRPFSAALRTKRSA